MTSDKLKKVEDVLILTDSVVSLKDSQKQEAIESLELVLHMCNEAVNNGEELVPDSIYDVLRERLALLNPSSPILHHVWSEDSEEEMDEELDSMLVHYPMLSIRTVKDYSDNILETFISTCKYNYQSIRLIISLKINGFGVRTVWQKGYLVYATTRGRHTQGKNITRQMQNICGEYNDYLKHYDHIEIRGEVALPFFNLELARQYNPNIKTAFTGVSSMIRESSSAEENKLLHFLPYNLYSLDLHFNYLSDKYEFLTNAGFTVPTYRTISVNGHYILDSIKAVEDELTLLCQDTYPYFTDGYIIEVDHLETASEFGVEEQYKLSNVAMKVGFWEQTGYAGTVKEIVWEEGKSQITPVAIVEGDEEGKGVLTAFGSRVSRVPLYTPYNIMLIEAYVGNIIYFKYGGEAGVVPTTREGKLLKEYAEEIKKGTPKVTKGKFLSYEEEELDDVALWDNEDFWS